MKIAIHGRKFDEESVEYIQNLFDELNQKKRGFAGFPKLSYQAGILKNQNRQV